MIRRSGENIAAREVEAVLNAFDSVAESAVVPVKDETRGEEVKPSSSGATGSKAPIVRSRRCLTIANSISHPSRYRATSKCRTLPKTPSGKIAKHHIAHADGPVFDRIVRAAPKADAGHV